MSWSTSTRDVAGAGLPASGSMRVMGGASRNSVGSAVAQAAIAADQCVGRAVVRERRLALARQLGADALRQHLAELDAPLVERIDVPDHALHEDAVLVERDQCAEDVWRQPLG